MNPQAKGSPAHLITPLLREEGLETQGNGKSLTQENQVQHDPPHATSTLPEQAPRGEQRPARLFPAPPAPRAIIQETLTRAGRQTKRGGVRRCRHRREDTGRDAVLTPAAKPKLPSRMRLCKRNKHKTPQLPPAEAPERSHTTNHTGGKRLPRWHHLLLPIPATQVSSVLPGKPSPPPWGDGTHQSLRSVLAPAQHIKRWCHPGTSTARAKTLRGRRNVNQSFLPKDTRCPALPPLEDSDSSNNGRLQTKPRPPRNQRVPARCTPSAVFLL